MTATDELRRLLDERGVEHFDGTETTLWGYEPISESTGVYRFAADETSGGRMQVRMFNTTPEQAVEATLGSGLLDENAKLRELARDAAILLDETCDTYFEDEYHEIVNRMRELGVEVDDG